MTRFIFHIQVKSQPIHLLHDFHVTIGSARLSHMNSAHVDPDQMASS